MDRMEDIVARLLAVGPRPGGSDAERRAARELQRTLLDGGREAELQTVWVRPAWAATHALHAVLGALGSVLAVLVPVAGAAVLGVTLLSLLLELAGWGWLARRLTPERASQNVVSPPPTSAPFRLLVTAHYDAGRSGFVYAERLQRLGGRAWRWTRGHVPGPFGWLTLALLAALGCAAARIVGATGFGVGLVQLLPTVALVLAAAAGVDLALSDAGPGASENAAGVAVALALTAALDAEPPRSLAVELVLAGAGDGTGAGLSAHLRGRPDALDPARTIVLGLRACGVGSPAWLSHEGTVIALPTHRQLAAACARAAGAEAHLDARPVRSHALSPLAPARRARLPAVTVGARDGLGRTPHARSREDTPARVDPEAMAATLEYCLALVDALDAELGRQERPS